MYGLLIALAVLVCSLIAEKLVKEQNIDSEEYWELLLKVIICGVVGARLYHVISLPFFYLANPIYILYINYGGLGIYGAIAGALFPIFIFFKSKKRHGLLSFLDITFLVLPLGQAMGRLGNFFNMEIVGLPTKLPWGMFVPISERPIAHVFNDRFHPLFLYESVMTFTLFCVLWLLYRGKSGFNLVKPGSSLDYKPGLIVALYSIGYGTIRFLLEFLRIEKWLVFGINMNQVVSLVLIIFGIVFLIKKKRPGAQQE